MTEPQPGEHWRFTHGGQEFQIEITETVLDGDVIHGTLVSDPSSRVIVPTSSVITGVRTL